MKLHEDEENNQKKCNHTVGDPLHICYNSKPIYDIWESVGNQIRNVWKVWKYVKFCKKMKIGEKFRKVLKIQKNHKISRISENMQKVINS